VDEAARLRELVSYAVLDTPPEPNFDRITSMAAAVFDKPICTMAFADTDRHWFKSRFGVDAACMPRRMSFCDQTIRGKEVFMVRDALADPRFAKAPVVDSSPHVRFYAGAPLIVSSGACIGSFCVLDTHPCDFDARQKRVLMDFAQISVELLEARSRQIKLARHSVEIARLARNDPLTGLANRRQLTEDMENALSQVQGDQQLAVLFIDLDHFKLVNDELGHHAGDVLLFQVAERLRACVRSTDKVARVGGDEFTVIQIGSLARRFAAELAQRLIFTLAQPYEVEGHAVTIGASIGIALGGEGHPLNEQLFREADAALYRAKSQGRNCFCFYETKEPNDLR